MARKQQRTQSCTGSPHFRGGGELVTQLLKMHTNWDLLGLRHLEHRAGHRATKRQKKIQENLDMSCLKVNSCPVESLMTEKSVSHEQIIAFVKKKNFLIVILSPFLDF